MNQSLQREYRKQRRYWNAETSLRHARIKAEFAKLDGKRVRLVWVPDQEVFDDSYIDTWTDQTEKKRERVRKELWDMIEREGVWGLASEVRCGECDEWREVDSCWGFVGQDAHGYEYDIMQAALDAVRS